MYVVEICRLRAAQDTRRGGPLHARCSAKPVHSAVAVGRITTTLMSPEDMEPPMLEVQCRALPVASIGKGHLSLSICCYSYRSGACCCRLQGLQQVSTVESSYCKIESSCGPGAAAFANKLDAVIFTILLEVGCLRDRWTISMLTANEW